MKIKLNKCLEKKIIFIIHHSQWLFNMVVVRNKNGEIKIFFDFKHMNKALDTYKYLVPAMEHIL